MSCTRLLRNVTLFAVATLLINSPAVAVGKHEPGVMKAKIVARGEGQDVRVTLADHTQVKGFIVSIHDENFVVKEKGPGEPRTIDYAQVTGVHRAHMPTGAKIGIGVGIGFLALLGVSAIVWVTSGGI